MNKETIEKIETKFSFIGLKYLISEKKMIFNNSIVHEFSINSLSIPLKIFSDTIYDLKLQKYSIILDLQQKKILFIE